MHEKEQGFYVGSGEPTEGEGIAHSFLRVMSRLQIQLHIGSGSRV